MDKFAAELKLARAGFCAFFDSRANRVGCGITLQAARALQSVAISSGDPAIGKLPSHMLV